MNQPLSQTANDLEKIMFYSDVAIDKIDESRKHFVS
jgi:hypothetical protein